MEEKEKDLMNCAEICRIRKIRQIWKNWKRIRQKSDELIRQFDILAVELQFDAS